MTNRISNSGRRKYDILKRAASPCGCLVNLNWCFAVTWEPAVKELLRDGQVEMKREKRSKTHGHTKLVITDKGYELMGKLFKQL